MIVKSLVVLALLFPAVVSAHTANLTGSASCMNAGAFSINWQLNLALSSDSAQAFSTASATLGSGLDILSGGAPTAGTTGNTFTGSLAGNTVYSATTSYATTPVGTPAGSITSNGTIRWSNGTERPVEAVVAFPANCVITPPATTTPTTTPSEPEPETPSSGGGSSVSSGPSGGGGVVYCDPPTRINFCAPRPNTGVGTPPPPTVDFPLNNLPYTGFSVWDSFTVKNVGVAFAVALIGSLLFVWWTGRRERV